MQDSYLSNSLNKEQQTSEELGKVREDWEEAMKRK
jgi:hypothetical protein